jgi:hypothetical protein
MLPKRKPTCFQVSFDLVATLKNGLPFAQADDEAGE